MKRNERFLNTLRPLSFVPPLATFLSTTSRTRVYSSPITMYGIRKVTLRTDVNGGQTGSEHPPDSLPWVGNIGFYIYRETQAIKSLRRPLNYDRGPSRL